MQTHPVEFKSVHVLADGGGFLFECRDHRQQPLWLQFPAQALDQLLRTLPQVEAGLHQGQGQLSSAILAHPVVDWCVLRSGQDQDVALCLRTDHDVETGFSFDLTSARAFHRELGAAIEHAAVAASPNPE